MFHVGRNDEAVAAFATAGGRGDPESTTIAVALRSALEIEARPGAAEGPDIVRAAEFFAGEGMPGRALALLETAAARLPNDPAVARHLSDLRRFYGLQERTPASF